MRRWQWVLLVAGVAAALGVWWYYRAHDTAVPAANRVRTVTVSRGSLAVTVSGSGVFSPAVEQKVYAPLGGKVKRVVEVGTVVKEGEPLVWLDASDLQQKVEEAERALETARLQLEDAELTARAQEEQAAQNLAQARSALRTAEINLESARTKLERSRALYEAQAIALADLQADEEALKKAEITYADAQQKVKDLEAQQKITAAQNELRLRQAKLNVEKATADLAEARADLAKAVVSAPFAGTVSSVEVKAGQAVAENAPLLTLIDTAKMIITLQVDETDIAKVKAGQEVDLSLDAYPNQSFKGKVVRIAPQAVQQNNISIFNVEVELANQDGRIRAGMTADGEILVAREENVLLVPLAAVQRQGRSPAVLVVENGQPRRVPVELGLDDGVNAVVKSGLTEGMTILLPTATAQSPTTNRATGWPGPVPMGGMFGAGGRAR